VNYQLKILGLLGIATCGAADALAQAPRLTGTPVRLQAVDPRYEDVGPLSSSLRAITADLKPPVNFEGVFRVQGHPGMLARRDGGLTAYFPRSVYWYTPEGQPFAQIAPGTVFVIGEPAPETLAVPGQMPGAGAEPRAGMVETGASPQPLASALGVPVEAQLSAAAPLEFAQSKSAVRIGTPNQQAAPAQSRSEINQRASADGASRASAPKLMEGEHVTTLDLSDEAYRGRRLRYLARKLGPTREE